MMGGLRSWPWWRPARTRRNLEEMVKGGKLAVGAIVIIQACASADPGPADADGTDAAEADAAPSLSQCSWDQVLALSACEMTHETCVSSISADAYFRELGECLAADDRCEADSLAAQAACLVSGGFADRAAGSSCRAGCLRQRGGCVSDAHADAQSCIDACLTQGCTDACRTALTGASSACTDSYGVCNDSCA